MIENVLNGIGGVGVFGVISICIFFGFFTGMALWAACLKKSYLNSMSGLPLDSESALPKKSSDQNHHE
jgi:hypothetical protein